MNRLLIGFSCLFFSITSYAMDLYMLYIPIAEHQVLSVYHESAEPCSGDMQWLEYSPEWVDVQQLSETQKQAISKAILTIKGEIKYHDCIRIMVMPLWSDTEAFAVPVGEGPGSWAWILLDPIKTRRLDLAQVTAHEVAHLTSGRGENGAAHWSGWQKQCLTFSKLVNTSPSCDVSSGTRASYAPPWPIPRRPHP